MTEKQTSWYWRLWQAACRAQAWRVQKGRLLNADLDDPTATAARSDWANAILGAAAALARDAHRAPTLDDLRHASHFVACGRACSHKQLRNHELTHWAWLMRLLVNPDDLEALDHWLHPDMDRQENIDAAIEAMPGAIVTAIARNRFQVADWRGLSVADKRSLHIQLKNRLEREHRPFTAQRERVLEEA